jgi:hypothetical protein
MPREDQLKLVANIATLPGIKVNEVRSEAGLSLLGEDEIGPDGKPIGEMILNLPDVSTEQGGHPDMPMANEVGRPPNPENTRAFPQRNDIMRGSGSAPRPEGSAPHRAQAKTGKSALEETIQLLEDAVALAYEATPVDHSQLARAVELELLSGKALPKASRASLVDAIMDLPEWSTATSNLAEEVRTALSEGIRRGYSTVQLWEGYAAEKFTGIQQMFSDRPVSDDVANDGL